MIKSFINYTGGKYRLIKQLFPLFPNDITNFVDLFSGSAVIGLNAIINFETITNVSFYDNNIQLIELMNWVKQTDLEDIQDQVFKIIRKYNLSDTNQNGYNHYNVDSSTGLAGVNREGFLKLREDYNSNPSPLYLYVLVIFGFNNQLRFNKQKHFNIPVGKRDFNKNIQKKLEDFSDVTKRYNVHFTYSDFRNVEIKPGTFYYVDPPYLISTATYNEGKGWTEDDERDLLNYLDDINNAGSKFALSNVFSLKGRSNTLLIDWVASRNYTVHHLNMSYNNSNYQTNKTGFTDEVLVTNY